MIVDEAYICTCGHPTCSNMTYIFVRLDPHHPGIADMLDNYGDRAKCLVSNLKLIKNLTELEKLIYVKNVE
jgi:hypothetical protein